MKIGDHLETISFFVTKLKYPIVLGLPWHRLHNPTINFETLDVSFNCHDSDFTINASTPPTHSLSAAECEVLELFEMGIDKSAIKSQTFPEFMTRAQEEESDILITSVSRNEEGEISFCSILDHHEYTKSGCELDDDGVPVLIMLERPLSASLRWLSTSNTFK